MTESETLEALFLRFREQADADALATVFDRTAPQLLLLAAHVTRGGAAAEDVVQETFLQAMAGARGWNATQPLLPWLCGILRHRALHANRHERLRRTVALGEAVTADPSDPAAGPEQVVADDDVLARVEAALAGMPLPYRDVLVLRLVHGLQPTAIAHALGRPPATVRQQLVRGLELLRGALPRSLAGALGLLLVEGRGLAAMRTHVLTAAGGGRAILRRAALAAWLLAGALLIAGTVWFFADGAEPGRHASAALTPPPGDAAVASSAVGRTLDPASGPLARTPSAAPTAAAPTVLRGRLVAAANRAPLAGEVEVSYGRGLYMTEDPAFHRWPEPARARTAADGTFAIAAAAAAERRVFLTAHAAGHVEVETEWTSLQNGIDVELGDIALARGTELRVRLVDGNGAPLADVQVEVHRRAGGDDGDARFPMWSSYEATSDQAGVLAPTMVPAPGAYELEVSRHQFGWRTARPTRLEVGVDATARFDVVVEPARSDECLQGRVVDELGEPLGGVPLVLHEDIDDLGRATSAADGTFRLATQIAAKSFPLHLPWGERGFRLLEPARLYQQGATDALVRVAVQPRHDVVLEVVDARTGAPVTAFGERHTLDCWSDGNLLRMPPDTIYYPATPSPRPAGRAVLALAPGPYRVSVFPANADLAPARLVPFVVGQGGAEPVRIELQPFVPLQVRVLDEAGGPVAGAKVDLVHLQGSKGDYTGSFTIEQHARGIGGGQYSAAVLASATTAADGRVTLAAPAAESRLLVLASGPHCPVTKAPLAPLPLTGGSSTLVVKHGAQLRGRVEPRALVDAIALPRAGQRRLATAVRAEDFGYAKEPAAMHLTVFDAADRYVKRVDVEDDGTFVVDAVPPGDLRLELEVDWQMGHRDGPTDTVPAGEVRAVRAGEVREVVATARTVPLRIGGRVFVDGARGPLRNVGWIDAANRLFTARLDDGVTFARTLPAGTWLPCVSWQDARGDHWLFADQRVALDRDHDGLALHFTPRRLRVALRTADGEPAAKVEVTLRCPDFPEVLERVPATVTTGDDGVLVLDPAPPGRVQFFLVGEAGETLLGEATGSTVEATMPTWTLPR